MTADKGSSPSRTATERSPESIHEKRVCWKKRSSTPEARSDWKQPSATANAAPTEPTPMTPTSFRGMRPAPSPFRIAPRSGSVGTSQRRLKDIASALQEVDVVHVGGLLVPEDRDENGETDRHFRRGHRHDEEDEDVPVHGAVLPREGHEREVHRVQHQLDRHEDDERAPSDQHADHADREEDRGQDLVGDERHQANFRLARTTAPTTATSKRMEVISNG